MASSKGLVLELSGREVLVTSPDKVVFPDAGHTKLDLVRYYLSVADGALRGVTGRPMVLKRFVKGIGEEAVFQKRAPRSARLGGGRRAALRLGDVGRRDRRPGRGRASPGWSTSAAST
jgi:hypothetical protein